MRNTKIKSVYVADTIINIDVNDNYIFTTDLLGKPFYDEKQFESYKSDVDKEVEVWHSEDTSAWIDKDKTKQRKYVEQLIDSAIDDAEEDYQSEFSAKPSCVEVTFRKVPIDKLNAKQIEDLLDNNPNLRVNKIEGESISFKTKDTFVLEKLEDDTLSSFYETKGVQ